MRALVQRASQASVTIADEEVGSIGQGLVVLLGISRWDTEKDAHYIVGKVLNLRIFGDDEGRFERSALETGAELLIISQFTLYGDTRKGRRPSFTDAAPATDAELLFENTLSLFRESNLRVRTGRFQAHMVVSIDNDGPVTLMVDSADGQRPRRG